VQSTKIDVLFISHEKELSHEDDKSKLGPVGGTTNFSKSVSQYFDHVVRFEISNKEHSANSVTTSNAKVVAGSRTDAKVMEGGKIVLANLLKSFPREKIEEAKKTVGEAKAALQRRPAGGLKLGKKPVVLGSKPETTPVEEDVPEDVPEDESKRPIYYQVE
jgi:hypothetical protein